MFQDNLSESHVAGEANHPATHDAIGKSINKLQATYDQAGVLLKKNQPPVTDDDIQMLFDWLLPRLTGKFALLGSGGTNAAPTATVQAITGTMQVGQVLTAHYTYADSEGNSEGASQLQWYASDDTSGTNRVAIGGASGLTYLPTSGLQNKYLQFGIVPVASTGTTTGTQVLSGYTTAIAAATAPATTLGVWRMDAGPQKTNTTFNGQVFEPDSSYLVTGSSTQTYDDNTIANTNYTNFYETSRYGGSGDYAEYVKAMPNGDYVVYVPLYAINGATLLNLIINGVQKESGLDVASAAGGSNRALLRSYNITVTTGEIRVRFGSASGTWTASGLEAYAAGTPSVLA